jgi:hypothetical protein
MVGRISALKFYGSNLVEKIPGENPVNYELPLNYKDNHDKRESRSMEGSEEASSGPWKTVTNHRA